MSLFNFFASFVFVDHAVFILDQQDTHCLHLLNIPSFLSTSSSSSLKYHRLQSLSFSPYVFFDFMSVSLAQMFRSIFLELLLVVLYAHETWFFQNNLSFHYLDLSYLMKQAWYLLLVLLSILLPQVKMNLRIFFISSYCCIFLFCWVPNLSLSASRFFVSDILGSPCLLPLLYFSKPPSHGWTIITDLSTPYPTCFLL